MGGGVEWRGQRKEKKRKQVKEKETAGRWGGQRACDGHEVRHVTPTPAGDKGTAFPSRFSQRFFGSLLETFLSARRYFPCTVPHTEEHLLTAAPPCPCPVIYDPSLNVYRDAEDADHSCLVFKKRKRPLDSWPRDGLHGSEFGEWASDVKSASRVNKVARLYFETSDAVLHRFALNPSTCTHSLGEQIYRLCWL